MSELHRDFAPAPLRQYALLADGERGALCGPHGEIVWLCAPRWHDDAVFSSLVGGAGAYAVTPVQRCVWGGHYEPATLIWRNRWVTDDGAVIECRDALAMPARTDGLVILRRVEVTEGAGRVRVRLDPRAAFGAEPLRELHRRGDGGWTGTTGGLHVRWTGAPDAHVDDDGGLACEVEVGAGQRHDFVLEIGARPLDGAPVSPDGAWAATEQAWREAVPAFAGCAAQRDTQHAYAVMRGLTSAGGGMVAAATMSLPERAGRGRNFDYRYVWIRDQCYAGIAVAADGPHPLLHDAVRFVTERLLADGDQITPAYLVDGGPVPDEEQLELRGYPGAADVRGNWVNRQFQLDALGEALSLFAAAARHDALGPDARRAARVAVAAIEGRWRTDDAGIWELDDDWWTHSRLSCVAGLSQLSDLVPRAEAGPLRHLADAILAETNRRCTHPRGHWQRTPSDPRVDGALLLPAVRGAVPPGDPRTVATIAAVQRDLVEDGYVYRFAPENAEPGSIEGAFLLCGFVLGLAHLREGNRVDAFRCFERNRAACGPPGLLSEEFDVRQRQLRGNLPQAFVHALLLELSVRL